MTSLEALGVREKGGSKGAPTLSQHQLDLATMDLAGREEAEPPW